MRQLFTLGQAADITAGRLVAGSANLSVGSVAVDGRAVLPGGLFVALTGRRVDGHQFLDQAARNGARAAMISRPVPAAPGSLGLLMVTDPVAALGRLARWYRARLPVEVVAVGGSVGKTTTKDFIGQVLATRWRVYRTPGNWNTEIGVPLCVFELDRSHRLAVLELAMRRRGEISYLARMVRPRVGVVTDVSEEHIELLGSMEEVARAEAELIENLPADGLAVLNGDNPYVRGMAAECPCPVVFYGTAADCQVRLEAYRPRQLQGGWALVRVDGETLELTLPVPGRHLAFNALAAVAVGRHYGLSGAEIADALSRAQLTRMRMEVKRFGDLVVIDDAYNASPASMMAALEVLDQARGPRRIAVLGNMLELGDHSRQAHLRVGAAVAARDVQLLVCVGELARLIGEEARRRGMPQDSVVLLGDSQEAARKVPQLVQPGDVVLVKGSRGMRMELVVDALREARP